MNGEEGTQLAIEYTDAELDLYLHAIWARQQRIARPPWGLWTIAVGGVAAVGGSFIAQAFGAIRPRDGTVVLILFAVYWIGFWAENARVWWGERRTRGSLREDQRRAFRDTALTIADRGIAVHRPGTQAFHEWRAIIEVVTNDVLILLFTEPGHAVAIPQRLLTTAQSAEILAHVDPDE